MTTRLAIAHTTTYRYDAPVPYALQQLRMRPRSGPNQDVVHWHLEVEGGHIGYAVRPSARGRGVATHLLALTLLEARRRGLSRVLLTCDDDNRASARVIEKNGGREIEPTISPRSGKVVRRFWIDVPPAQFFKGSPVLEVLDFLERLAPFTSPALVLRDSRPVTAAEESL